MAQYQPARQFVPATTPRTFRVRKRRARMVTKGDTLAVESASRFGGVCVAFVLMMLFLFIKVIVLVWLQRSAVAVTGDPMAVTQELLFWLVLVLCLIPMLGISSLLFWLANAHQDSDALTAHEKLLLKEGQLALGVVRAQHRHELEVHFLDAEGQRHTVFIEAYDRFDLERYPVGSELNILLDPQSPEICLSPALLGAEFKLGDSIEDRRPDNLRGLKLPPMLTPELSTLRLTLLSTLRPMRLSWVMIVHHLMAFRRRKSVEIGTLVLNKGVLNHTLANAPDTSLTVDLNQPFVAEMSVWVLSSTVASVHVGIRQCEADPTTRSLCFQTELSQSMLSSELPMLQTSGPCLDPEAFLTLWATLRYYGKAHGITIV